MPADEDDRQDLRLAVVMTGGVSLAVWMGGVAHEINRLVRRDDPVYAAMLDLTHSTVRVDVISGTSAGGLNGALLATSQARGADMSSVRDVWLETGSLDRLLRPATEADPPSFLRGDYFRNEIERALRAVQGEPAPLDSVPVHLVVTGTVLNGVHRGVPDDFGSVVRDVDHRAQFTFRRSVADGDDFDGPDAMRRLALAARCSASFPLAFEPVHVGVGGDSGAQPDMAGYADFVVDRWLVDGGVLVNKPLGPALDAVFAQPADRQVRRVLAYVVPDPGEGIVDQPESAAEMPMLTEVGVASFLRIPRNQSVQDLLDTLARHNRRVAAQRRRRELTAELELSTETDLGAVTRTLYPRYRLARAERLTDLVMRLLAHGATEDVVEGGGPTDTVMPNRRALRSSLLRHLGSLPPAAFPAEGAPVEDWFTTSDTVERAAVVVLDLLRRGMGLAPPDAVDLRAALRGERERLHAHLLTARALRPQLSPKARDALGREVLEAAADHDLEAWAAFAIERFFGRAHELDPTIRAIAGALPGAARLCLEAWERAPAALQRHYAGTDRFAAGLSQGLGDGDDGVEAALRRLLQLEIVQVALGEEPVTEQAVELLQMSADVANGFDGRDRPEEKLAGLQLAHFGAFYKRSWRANDWLWGRLDAVQRLALVLADPFRLRQLQMAPETVVEAIVAIALPEDPDQRAVLERYGSSRVAIAEELAFLGDPDAALPEKLPRCARMIARRLQLEILQDEMPRLLEAVARDAREDGKPVLDTPSGARTFAPAEAVERFVATRVGEERILAEQGTDRFARIATHGAAVTTAAVGGARAGIGGRGRLRFGAPLRAAGLAVYAVTDAALQGTRAGAATVVAAAVAGAGLIGVALFVRLPSVLLLLGLGLLAATLTAAFLRRRQWWAIAGLLVGVLLAVAPRAVTAIFGWEDSRVVEVLRPYEAAWVVVALALGAVAAASATASSPKRRSV